MRVAYIGNFKPSFSTENHVRISLEALGHEVIKLQEDGIRTGYLRRNCLSADLVMHTTTWDSIPHQEALRLWSDCKEKGIPVVGYHLDLFWGLSRQNRKWQSEPMFKGDWLFSTDGNHEEEWKSINVNHYWLPAGVVHTETVPGIPRHDFMCDVAFVGSDGKQYHPEWTYRRELVQFLQSKQWEFRNPGGAEPKLRERPLNDFYASAKVTVGDSLCLFKEKSLYWSDRVYEATGRGGLLIMPQIDALDDQFDGHLPMYPWGDFETLEQMVYYFLKRPESRAIVRQTCWSITKQRHTYLDRMREMLGHVFN